MYLKCNSNLLYHGCIPLTADGQLKDIYIRGEHLKGKAALDRAEKLCREAYFNRANSADSPEDKVKADYNASSRCMPFDQTRIDDKCVVCGMPAKYVVLFDRAY